MGTGQGGPYCGALQPPELLRALRLTGLTVARTGHRQGDPMSAPAGGRYQPARRRPREPSMAARELGLDRNICITYGSHIGLLVRNYEPTKTPSKTNESAANLQLLPGNQTIVLKDTPTSYWQ